MEGPKLRCVFGFTAAVLLLSVVLPTMGDDAAAVPSFARKYKTSCTTCHYAFPRLNAFGKAYMNNGYRYPEGQDPEMTKEDPVSLGAEAYKKVWPDAIWPADIAGTTPVSFHAVGRLLYFEDEDLSTFEIPHELEFLFAGTIGDDISYFGEFELEHEAEFGYEFLVQYDFNPAVHLAFGSVGLTHATPNDLRLTKHTYNLVDLKNQSGTWRMRDGAGGGMAVWGAMNGAGGRGGLTYRVGVGNGQNDEDNFDLNKDKDVFGRVTYKIGGLGEAGGTTGQGAEESAFYVDDSFRLGAYGYFGTAVDDTRDEDEFWVLGGDVEWWFRRLVVSVGGLHMASDYLGNERDSFAAFAEGNYVLYPWLIGYARHEFTDKDTRDGIDPVQSLIPAIIAMVRANVKWTLEYRIPLDDLSEDTGDIVLQFDFAF